MASTASARMGVVAAQSRYADTAPRYEFWAGSTDKPSLNPKSQCYRVDMKSNSVGLRELRQQASAVLKRVVQGEVIEVTDHGHPIARIVPLRPGALAQMVSEGRSTGAGADLLDLAGTLGLPAEGAGPVLPSAALAELRADER